MTIKKNRILLLVCLLCLITCMFFLVSCGRKSNNGKINYVEIEKAPATEATEKNEFTEMDIPFNYSVKTLTNGMSYQNFKVPKSFTSRVSSARHRILEVPEDDKHIPGATLHMLYNYSGYGFCMGESKKEEDSEEKSASNYVDLFSWELPNFSYNFNGDSYTLRKQDLGDEIVSGADFTKKSNSVCCTVANDVDLLSTSKDVGPEGASQITYYYKWQNIPCCISTVVPENEVKAAKKIMQYIISSSTYASTKFDSRETYKLQESTLSLPTGFKTSKDADNILYYPETNTKNAMSGITVGEFYIDTNKTAKLTSKNMDSSYSAKMAQILSQCGGSYSFVTHSDLVKEEPSTLGGKKAAHYQTMVTMDGGSGTEDSPYAGSFYGEPAICYFDTLVSEVDGTQRILCVFYQEVQRDVAKNILSIAAKSVSYD